MQNQSNQSIVVGLTIIFSFISLLANAQLGESINDTLYSNVLQEKRPLEIIFPKSYKKGSQNKYTVMYLVDGEWAKSTVSNTYDFLVGAKFVPEHIYVLIPNLYIKDTNLRDRDLSPTKVVEYSPHSGGADNFIAFLKKELIPYINQKYPSNGNNTLVGSSLGGMFTIYAFLKEPQLFKSYVTSEASLMWDNMYVNKLALETLPKLQNLENTTLWFSGRAGRHFREMGMAEMDSILKVMAPKGLIWKSATYPNETHYSLGYKGLYDGFKFTFKGYQKELRVAPLDGILLKDEPFTALAWQFKDSLSLYYTTDGSAPTRSSKEFNFFIPLDSSASLTIKSITNRSDYDQMVKGEFKQGKLIMPKKKIKSSNCFALFSI